MGVLACAGTPRVLPIEAVSGLPVLGGRGVALMLPLAASMLGGSGVCLLLPLAPMLPVAPPLLVPEAPAWSCPLGCPLP